MVRALAVIALTAGQLATSLSSRAAEKPVDFSREVLPILSENCFLCHGPDAKTREAELRLDSFAGATAKAIVPGNSDDSVAIRRIYSSDPDERMPPPAAKRSLTEEQKQVLKRWVDEGAQYAKHWAFTPPVRPPVPVAGGARLQTDTANAAAPLRNPVDAFVAARLAAEGLQLSPAAEKAKLLRRLALDLSGLPPTLEQLDAFLADPSDAAYEQAVDRLLESPRYGERMVWEWLDAARYADTNGYQGDPTRAMWYWRDWAIAALNSNMPFDQFTVEQLAGDLLPAPTLEQLVATGFHRNHMINGEGGRIAEESRVEYVQDRVETTATVWMGLTLTCCRCHDHKYDPFTQKEYYQLAAYFNSIEESGANDAGGLANPVLALVSPELQRNIDALKSQEQEAEQALAALQQQVSGEQPQWEKTLLGGDGRLAAPSWTPLTATVLTSEQGAALAQQDDRSILAAGANPATDDYLITVQPQAEAITGFRLEALPDASFPSQGPGRAENGNFVLSELTLQADGRPVELSAVAADFSQQGWDAAGAFDGNPASGWAVLPEFGKPHSLVFAPRTPLGQTGGTEGMPLSFRLAFRFGGQHSLGRFRLSATADPPELVRLPENIRTILARPAGERSEAERQQLTQFYLDSHPLLAAAKSRRDTSRKARGDAEKSAPRTMVMRDRAEPRETFVLAKGAYNAPGDKVEHGVLTGLSPLPAGLPANRLALARWLVAAEHPLTARVAVNRLWQQFFGLGLVKSSEDFGVQGDKPSHPELLDWLAVEFRESGWNVKQLVRLIVTSSTYRQSSHLPPGMAERDPDNRLLARGPRYRLPSWMLRDQALAAGGLLVERLGGPPVKGYQPDGVWEDATFGQIRYSQDHGEALYRRSLYTFWRRIVAPTIFFDVANRQNCTVKSSRTNSPLHALVTLNDVTFVEAARGLAQRTLLSKTAGDDTGRLAEMFRRCTCRAPQAGELDLLSQRLGALRSAYAQDSDAARKLIAVGEMPADATIDPGELASWESLALMMLNLDETITKE